VPDDSGKRSADLTGDTKRTMGVAARGDPIIAPPTEDHDRHTGRHASAIRELFQ